MTKFFPHHENGRVYWVRQDDSEGFFGLLENTAIGVGSPGRHRWLMCLACVDRWEVDGDVKTTVPKMAREFYDEDNREKARQIAETARSVIHTEPLAHYTVNADGGMTQNVPIQSSFERDLQATFDEARALLLKKHHDYGPRNISDSPGGPLNGLLVRQWDKMARLRNLMEKGAEPSNESVRDTWMDMMNYSAIALMVIDKKWPEE